MAISESDLIQLNAYLDGELSAGEQLAFEQRLEREPALRAELESLRVTVALIGMASPVRAPRSFTLDPAVYGRPARRSFWERLGIPQGAGLAAAGVSLVATLMVAGGLVVGLAGGLGSGMLAAPADRAAEAPVYEAASADMQQETGETMAGEAPMEEAPAEPMVGALAAPEEVGGENGAAAEESEEPAQEPAPEAAAPSPTTTMPPAGTPPPQAGEGDRTAEGEGPEAGGAADIQAEETAVGAVEAPPADTMAEEPPQPGADETAISTEPRGVIMPRVSLADLLLLGGAGMAGLAVLIVVAGLIFGRRR
jgi:hypothetical protein